MERPADRLRRWALEDEFVDGVKVGLISAEDSIKAACLPAARAVASTATRRARKSDRGVGAAKRPTLSSVERILAIAAGVIEK